MPRIFLGTFFLVILISLAGLSQLGIKISKQQAPLSDAAMEIKYNLAIFHLWFEEFIQGDKTVKIDHVWSFLDASEWYANAMLSGGKNNMGTFIPLDDQLLRGELAFMFKGIADLRKKAEVRLNDYQKGRIASDLDQAFDKSFGLVLQKADKVEAQLHKAIYDELEWYAFISNTLMIIFVFVSLTILIGLTYYERRRQSDLNKHHALIEQINQSQKMEVIGSLVGSVAHNFNNLLAGIIGKAYMAKRNLREQPEKALTHLESIESISTQAGDMVKQLLTFAHKDFGRDKKNMQLGLLVKEGFKTAKLGIASEIITSLNISSTDMLVCCDANQIQQVLMNLMNNARDAVEDCENKRISVSLDVMTPSVEFFGRYPKLVVGKFACLQVSDSGCGMDSETQDSIFEPFYTTKRAGVGTGLGLSTAFGSVTSHGGMIEVDSELNNGTTFKVYLPIIEADIATDASEPVDSDKTIMRSAKKETILLVEDEPILRHSMQEILADLGYQVITASDGFEGLACFQQHHIDCVVTDVMMPNMNGVEMFRKIRDTGSAVPLIFMTGYDAGSAQLQTDEMKNATVISKPAQIHELSKLIKQLI